MKMISSTRLAALILMAFLLISCEQDVFMAENIKFAPWNTELLEKPG